MRCSRRCLDCVYPGGQQQDKDHHSFRENNSASEAPTDNISAVDPVSFGTSQENLDDISGNGHNLTALMLDQIHNESDESSDSLSTRRYTTGAQSAPWAPIAGYQTSDHPLASSLASDDSATALWQFRNDGLQTGVEVLNQQINWLPFDEFIDLSLGPTLDETVLLSPYNDAQWPSVSTSTASNGLLEGQVWNLDIPPLANGNGNNSNGASKSASIRDTSPPKSSSFSNYKRGDLYATSSNGARNACSTRAKRDDGAVDNDICDLSMAISDLTYDTILQRFNNFTTQMQSHLPDFRTPNPPSLSLLNIFVKLYFKCFDPILPFVHLPSLDINRSWVLAIAIAAVGSHYFRSQETKAHFSLLHEFCTRSIQQKSECSEEEMTDLPMLQARILNHLGLCYSESKKPNSFVMSTWSFTLSLIHSQSRKNFLRHGNDGLLKPHIWNQWVEAESWRRLYFTARVLHTMMIYHFHCDIDQNGETAIEFDLPQETLWQAQTHDDWTELFMKSERNPSLSEAITDLFRDKSVRPNLGEFSHCIILHEVYNEIAKITIFHSRQLASWTPTSESRSVFPVSSSKLSSPGARKLIVLGHSIQYSNAISDWRNAALDCVDVLHWAANAKIASLSGAEHPMVLHLHYSRIVLLVPRVALMTIAESVSPVSSNNEASVRRNHSQKVVEAAEHLIREWTQRDSSKARLAIIHGGCLFWHVRRYSRATFYDPLSVFYATLALWAYGFYTPKKRGSVGYGPTVSPGRVASHVEGTVSGEQELGCDRPGSGTQSPPTHQAYSRDRDLTFIRLDRPNDDEMVQLFVSSSQTSKMSALISGVGDICGPEGPALVLKEGRAMLGAIPQTWIQGSHYMDTLFALENATRSRSLRSC
ncbi:hypothetical protein HDV63DRAFT_174058 [Trichoderma sp. SZMC 28014]